MLLDQCDGFLNKPLDVALLLSELLRLTLPIRQTLLPQTTSQENNQQSSSQLGADDAAHETLAPLILVVEDSPTNQKIACKILENRLSQYRGRGWAAGVRQIASAASGNCAYFDGLPDARDGCIKRPKRSARKAMIFQSLR